MSVFRVMLCGGIVFAVCIGITQAETTVDISVDSYHPGDSILTGSLTTEITEGVVFSGTADTDSYGEVFVGTSFDVGEYVSFAPYVGMEWTREDDPKVRGLVEVGLKFDQFEVATSIEFLGVTGLYHETLIGWNFDTWSLFAVHDSDSGDGALVVVPLDDSLSIYSKFLWKDADEEGKNLHVLTLGFSVTF